MNTDFYGMFQTYSNDELLKVVFQHEKYQVAAVEAARQVLSERRVTGEEERAVKDVLSQAEAAAAARGRRVKGVKTKVADFFQPVLQPSEEVGPQQWVNMFLVLVSIQYAWTLYTTARSLIAFMECRGCSPGLDLYTNLVTIIYVPFVFFLLLKRRRWGWILIFAENLISLIGKAGDLIYFFQFGAFFQQDILSVLLPAAIRLAFVFFLWRKSIAGHFGIDRMTKRDTVLFAMGLGVAAVWLFG